MVCYYIIINYHSQQMVGCLLNILLSPNLELVVDGRVIAVETLL
jgi:hypothetical protein